MELIKKNLKLFVGIAVLILVAVIFFIIQGSTDLERSNMRTWRSASVERRVAAIKILTGGDISEQELMLQCMDKVASLPNSSEMMVRDSASLCYAGIKLKQNI